jgi:hypothetical protein
MPVDLIPDPVPEEPGETLDSQAIEPDTHAFVIRLWLENETQPVQWRGHITHVFSGRQQQVSQLSQIDDFIGSYLNDMGIDDDPSAP